MKKQLTLSKEALINFGHYCRAYPDESVEVLYRKYLIKVMKVIVHLPENVIVRSIESYYSTSLDELIVPTKERKTFLKRVHLIYLLDEFTNLTHKRIGQIVGRSESNVTSILLSKDYHMTSPMEHHFQKEHREIKDIIVTLIDK